LPHREEERDVGVRRGVLDAIAAHARAEAPRECCGLLIGAAERIDEAARAENIADEPERRYVIDPAAYFAALRRCRGTPASVIGAYHSHPRSAPEPSATDLAQAFGDFLYVIAGPIAGPGALDIRAYRLKDGNFRAVTLVPVP
jgi:desampylase